MDLFDRDFVTGDQQVFDALVGDMVGQPCASWRKSYGRSGSLHFGKMNVRGSAPPRTVYSTQGTWIVGLWDCDRFLSLRGDTLDSTVLGDSSILNRLQELEGLSVQGIRVDPTSFALTIEFSRDTRLVLTADPTASENDEQWAIQLPDARAIVMYGHGRWVLAPPDAPIQ